MNSHDDRPKNIIVCADGTGNKGGSSPDSNVYRVYKMVNKYHHGPCKDGVDVNEQILFYDNGIGTSKNKIIRAVSAGIGLGFKDNVCDLYKFIARNYKKNDRIYFFGFSRGASTVRACNGMISKCGLVKSGDLGNSALQKKVDEVYEAYKKHKTHPEPAKKLKGDDDGSWGAVDIEFLGVWDTVVALGFPKRTDITDPISGLLNVTFAMLEKCFDILFPHNFYHYKLTDNVKYACQALAIDDERTAFWPYVWQEKNIEGAKDRTPDNVNQVWFTGMHANVGGGYERDGLAGIPLHWLMQQAEEKGLVFNSDAAQIVQNSSHIHGRMYDTRLGLKMIYRYHPREIEKLCKTNKGQSILLDKIKIHNSVIERMFHRTANYTPTFIPSRFDVVGSNCSVETNPGSSDKWIGLKNTVDSIVLKRKWLYSSAAALFLIIVGSTIYYWNYPAPPETKEYLSAFVEILDYFTFDMFNNVFNVVIVKRPEIFLGTVGLGLVYLYVRHFLRKKLIVAGESMRRIIMESLPENKD